MEKPSAQNITDRAVILEQQFLDAVSHNQLPEISDFLTLSDVEVTPEVLLSLFESQLVSRHLDYLTRALKRNNQSYYTIGSCGHEGNAAIGQVFRHTDMAFLHYRSGALMLQRAKKVPEVDMLRNIILSFIAAKDDPIASGRHKVFGSVPLHVPPQTSTIASHLHKAVGAAAAIKRARTLNIQSETPADSVVLCSFGDASVNHSSALGAFNTARWVVRGHYPLPIVFICEDNGWGISVKTPEDWVESTFANQRWLHYIQADGLNVLDTVRAAREAERIARIERQPVFLHIKCVRLLGHAGTDYELSYRDIGEIVADEAKDPLLYTARLLLDNQVCSNDEIIQQYQSAKQKVHAAAQPLIGSPQLDSTEAVMASLVPPKRDIALPKVPSESQRRAIFGEKFAKLSTPLNLSQQLNFALTDIMLRYPNTIVLGEDVAKNGGVYRVTQDLQQRFRPARVFDSLLDEQSILGYAIGHAHNGFIPIPEIQFLAYLHNAADQIRGEAATLSFFSNGQFTNPMVVRVPSFAYQKGFGGHFHNDNAFAFLREIPGLIIACPSNGPDAVKMLKKSIELAYLDQRIVIFLEPIALYMERDLYEAGDQQWLFPYPDPADTLSLGELGIYGESDDIAIISYGNGLRLSLQAAHDYQQQHGKPVKVIDLRWLQPLPLQSLLGAIKGCKKIVMVDESRRTGSLSEELFTALQPQLNPDQNLSILSAEDCFIPLGNTSQYILPTRDKIKHHLENL